MKPRASSGPWKKYGCLSSVCTLWDPLLLQYRIWLCVGARSVRRGSGHFHGTPSSTAARVCFTGFFLQQKGNRCALMSTADYSRNIARKMRPRSSDGLSVKTTLVSVLPHELGGFLFWGGGGEPTGWQLPVQHRRQRQNPTCPHPLLVHVTAALLSPNIERVPPTPYRF